MPVQTQNLLDRIAVLLKVNLQDLLMESADPQEAAAHWRAEIKSGLADAKDAVARALAQERQIERRLQAAQSSIEKWDAKVDAALQAGDEDRARTALNRKMTCERITQDLQAKLDHHRQVIVKMKASVNALQEKGLDLEGFAPFASLRGATQKPRSGSKTP